MFTPVLSALSCFMPQSVFGLDTRFYPCPFKAGVRFGYIDSRPKNPQDHLAAKEAILIENLMLFLKYYNERILLEFLQHLKIIGVSIPISILVSVPIGIYISSRPRIAKIVIYIAGILMTIPSLALFGIMVVSFAPWGLGLGMVPAVTAITIYSLLPITRNTYTALNSVPAGVLEAAKGMGFSKRQTLWKIRIPLSIPVIMAGVRTSVVLGVSVATFATLVGAGGLGYFIFSGISRSNFAMVLVGAVLVSALGIGVNWFFMQLEIWLTPRGLRVGRK